MKKKNKTLLDIVALSNPTTLCCNHNVTTLDLSECNIGDTEIIVIIKNLSIKKLNISDNHYITYKTAEALTASYSINNLDISRTSLRGKAIELISTNNNITSLNLADTYIMFEEAGQQIRSFKALKALAANKALIELNLDHCGIGNKGVEILTENQTITNLSLKWNYIEDNAVIKKLCNNYNLLYLNLEANPVIKLTTMIDLLTANKYLKISPTYRNHDFQTYAGSKKNFLAKCKISTLNDLHCHNYQELVNILQLTVEQQYNNINNVLSNESLVVKKDIGFVYSCQILHDITLKSRALVLHQLKTNKALAELIKLPYIPDQVLKSFERYKNIHYFELKGISSMRENSLANSVFKHLPADMFCEITKYLSLNDFNCKIQLINEELSHSIEHSYYNNITGMVSNICEII